MSEFMYKPEPISFGHGHVPYAPAGCGTNGIWLQEGWCLPGGERTTNRQRAFAVCVEIDRLYSQMAALKEAQRPKVTVVETWP